MARCYDCHWFEHAPPVARKAESCSDIGELAQTAACVNFTDKVAAVVTKPDITPTPMESLEDRKAFLGALMDEPFAHIFHEILAENFVLSQDARLAIKTIQAQLQTQGASVQAPSEDFNRTVNKMIDLFVTYRLANAVGLGAFVDQIMEREIARKFSAPRKA